MSSTAVLVFLSLMVAARAEDGWVAMTRCWTEETEGCLELQRTDLDLGGGLLLKRAEGRKARALEDHGLYSKLATLFSGRSLVLTLPEFSGRQLEQGVEEGRGKMKKMGSMMMMMGATKAMMIIPMMLGSLFLLAGKALIIAKVALVLAVILTLKKLVSAKQESSGGWSGGGGGWDRRSFASHELAYSAHAGAQ